MIGFKIMFTKGNLFCSRLAELLALPLTNKPSKCPHRGKDDGAFGCTGCMPSASREKKEMFGGENADQYNAVAEILTEAAGGWDEIYDFLEKTPRATLIVTLIDSLLYLGYKITTPPDSTNN